MKRFKTLILFCVILGVLIAAYFLVTALVRENTEDGGDVTEAETYPVAEVPPENLRSLDITVTDTEGEEAKVTKLSFALNDDCSRWLWAEDPNVPLDNTAFASIISALSGTVTEIRKTGVTEEKLAEFGLDKPYIRASFGFADGSTEVYLIGKFNSFNRQYYFCSEKDRSTVYMVGTDVADSLNLTVAEALQWDTVPEITEAKITSLTFEGGEHRYVYTFYPNGKEADYTLAFQWYLSVDGGEEFPVSPDLGTGLTTALTSLSFGDCAAFTAIDPAEYGLDKPVTVTVAYGAVNTVTDSETGAGTEVVTPAKYVLSLGSLSEDGYYYCRTETSQLVYTLFFSDVLQSAQSEELRTLRPNGLIYPDFDRIDSLRLSAGDRTLAVNVTHGADSVSYRDASGAELNYDRFTAVTDALSALKAGSDISAVPAAASAGSDLLFSAEIAFGKGNVKNAVLEIRRYSENWCRVSFLGRDDQLITAEEAQSLVQVLQDYFRTEA